jgi:hypothetical protein
MLGTRKGQMSTKVEEEVDLFTMVGEMPEVVCEHEHHEVLHAEGPATYYVSSKCYDCGRFKASTAVCDFFIIYLLGRNVMSYCPACRNRHPMQEGVKIIGRVK